MLCKRLKKLFNTPHIKFFAFCFGLLSSICLSLFSFTSSASAFGLTGTDQYAIQEADSGFGTAINNAQGTWIRIYTLQKASDDYWVNLPASGLSAVTVMSLRLNKNIPANSLVSLSITWTTESVTSTGFIYHSLQFEHNRSLLWDSCINFAGQPIYSSDKFMTLTCNYVFYNASDTAIIDSIYGSHIWEVIHQGDVDDHVNVVIRQPTSIQLSNNGLTSSDRLWLQQNMPGISQVDFDNAVDDVIAAQNSTTNAVRAQTQQQHDDYEAEVEREENKQSELEDSAEDLSLSASSTGNPFANMFNASGCVNMPIVGGWFGNSNLKVCSPYPATIANILNFVGSVIIVGFLIRIYYKHMSGGFQS